jgi:hypothetical protein
MSDFLAGTPDEKTISLFMKKITSRDQRNSHWLLVQTHRSGTDQVAQAAWKIYPNEVDLTNAATPFGVLRAFVNAFGCPIKVEGKEALFVAEEVFPYEKEVVVNWDHAPTDHFYSVSVVRDSAKKAFVLGATYCIDLSRYRSALRARGLRVADPQAFAKPILKNEARILVNQGKITITRPHGRDPS